jgi:cob(I)alamin adenosyltransferase
MKIYTKTGDAGTTSLIGGERVSKCDPRVEAYGTVDELMAFVALMTDTLVEDERTSCFAEALQRVESQLMTVAALFAVGKGGEGKVAPIAEERISELEQIIDAMQQEIPAITKFTIPGGHRAVSLCHVCRTVCRRAERAALRANDVAQVDATALKYLNRLSDYLYTLGRVVTERLKVEERLWIP